MAFKVNDAILDLKTNGKYFRRMMNVPVAEDYRNRVIEIFGENFPDVNPTMFDLFLFSFKKIETSRTGSKDYIEKLASYRDPRYNDSKSNRNLDSALEKVRMYLSTIDPSGINGVKQLIGKDEKISAGAFIYAFEKVIEEKARTIITVIPNNNMANYQRALFMVLNMKEAYAVAMSRLRMSLTIVKILSKKGITITPEDVTDNGTKGAAVERWEKVFPKFIDDIPFVAPKEELSSVLLEANMPFSSLPIDDLLAGAFPVNYHMILQNKDFRRHERIPCDLGALKAFVMEFLLELFTHFGQGNLIQKGLDVMDKKSQVAQMSWVYIKCLKFITKVIRPARKAGFLKKTDKPTQGIRRTRLIL